MHVERLLGELARHRRGALVAEQGRALREERVLVAPPKPERACRELPNHAPHAADVPDRKAAVLRRGPGSAEARHRAAVVVARERLDGGAGAADARVRLGEEHRVAVLAGAVPERLRLQQCVVLPHVAPDAEPLEARDLRVDGGRRGHAGVRPRERGGGRRRRGVVEEDDGRAGELLAEVRRDGVQFRGVALVDVGPDVDEDYAREPPGGDEGQPGQAETPERAP